MRTFRIFALLVVVLTGITFNLTALPTNGVYREFYSDNTFTTMVGWKNTDCVGGRSQWGVTSNYVWSETWSCEHGWTICQKCDMGDCWLAECPYN